MTEQPYARVRVHIRVTPRGTWGYWGRVVDHLPIGYPRGTFGPVPRWEPITKLLVVSYINTPHLYHVYCVKTRTMTHAFDDLDAATTCAVTLAN